MFEANKFQDQGREEPLTLIEIETQLDQYQDTQDTRVGQRLEGVKVWGETFMIFFSLGSRCNIPYGGIMCLIQYTLCKSYL